MSEDLDEIFRRAKDGRVLFSHREALRPEHIPEKLPFREKQTNAVAEVLAPALHGSKPSNLLLYGKTGTGKTAVAKRVLEILKERSKVGPEKITIAYVNTKFADTEYRTLAEFAEFFDLPRDRRIPFTGISTAEAISRIFDEIRLNKAHVILVMDEIDSLVNRFGDRILYDLTRSGDRLSPGFLALVGISNDLKFKDGLDPRVLSSLSEEELVFPPYTVEELRAILTERAQSAFRPGVVSAAAINLCAARAGSEHGDARRAIDLLRISGEVAEREGRSDIGESCVDRASEKMEHDRIEEAIRSLPTQNKAILMAVSNFTDGTNTGGLYRAYTSLCKKAGLEILTQRRVSGILGELDMLGLIEASVVSKGRRGRTKRIRLLIGSDALTKTLSEDPTFTGLF